MFFKQPLLNGFSTGDGSFLPTNSHEGKMKKMIGFLRWQRLTTIHVSLFKFSMHYVFCSPILYCNFLV